MLKSFTSILAQLHTPWTYVFNPLKRIGIRWLNFEMFNAIQVSPSF